MQGMNPIWQQNVLSVYIEGSMEKETLPPELADGK
jgi:hypothetical protein